MEGKCYLCDHEFVEGEEPWLIFEQRLCEIGTAESTLADLLSKILNLGYILNEQNSHSPYLCDSCNADVMEYESLCRRLKEVHCRMLGYYGQNVTITHLKKHVSTEEKPISNAESATAVAVSANLNEMLDNNSILRYLVEEIPDEEEKSSALFNLNDNNLSFGVLTEHVPSEVLNLPENLSPLCNISQDNLDSQSMIQGKEGIIMYGMDENYAIQFDKPKKAEVMESDLNFEVASIAVNENEGIITYDVDENGTVQVDKPRDVEKMERDLNFEVASMTVNENKGIIMYGMDENFAIQFDKSKKTEVMESDLNFEVASIAVNENKGIITYDVDEDGTIQIDKPRDVDKMESDLTFEVASIAVNEIKNDKSVYINNVVAIESEYNDITIQESTLKVVSKKQGSTFLCLLCNGFFPFERKTIEDHLQSIHQSKLYMCDICSEGYTNEKDLQEHCVSVHVLCKAQHGCEVCLSTFDSRHQLRLHKRIHHSHGKSHECPVCGKRYHSRSVLSEHMHTHTGQRPYKCVECSKDFASKYTLQTHMKIHADRERPFKCDTCDKSFFNQQNLNQHKKLHVPFKAFTCDVCLKNFATQHSLNVHMIVHTGQKPFICRVCNKAFARRPEIKDHERIHTGEKPFKCDLCPIAFSQRSNLTSHKKSTHFNEKLHRCNQCERSFKRRRLLQYHILAVHTGERPYKCNTCDSAFVYPEHFKKHMLIHSSEKPFACEVCGKQFNSRDNRNAHRFVHSDKKPYECMECGAGFMRKPLLLTHMKHTKHLSDKIIVNQPQFTIREEGNLDNLNNCSNEQNSVFVNKANDAAPKVNVSDEVSLSPEVDNNGSLTTMIGQKHLSEHNVDNVKYLEFGDNIENVDNQTIT